MYGGRSECELESVVRKGMGLGGLNDWKNLACITREKSVISGRSVMTF